MNSSRGLINFIFWENGEHVFFPDNDAWMTVDDEAFPKYEKHKHYRFDIEYLGHVVNMEIDNSSIWDLVEIEVLKQVIDRYENPPVVKSKFDGKDFEVLRNPEAKIVEILTLWEWCSWYDEYNGEHDMSCDMIGFVNMDTIEVEKDPEDTREVECNSEQYAFLVDQMEERRAKDEKPKCIACLDMGYVINSQEKKILDCTCEASKNGR